MSKNYCSWIDVERHVASLASRIDCREISFDLICPIPRGGWNVAALLAQHLRIKKTVSVDVYDITGKRSIVARNSFLSTNRNVLLIEDTVHTGKTINSAQKAFISDGASGAYTAALFVHSECATEIDFYIDKFDELPEFPWDK